MFRFESPWAFLALLFPILLGLWRLRRPSPRPALRVATIAPMAMLPRTWRVKLRWLPAALAAAAWCLFTIALARPQLGQEQIKDVTQGIAIEMIVDRSGSMRAPMNFRHRSQDRLETVKAVFQEFVFGDRAAGLEGRHSDLLGVIAFAHYPYTFCPLTLDHNALKFALSRIELITEQSDENGTAVGDAVAMGVARLQDAERTLAAQTQKDASAYRLKSKVIILLTDGQDEGPHTRSIPEAAELAKKHGIKVYTIAIVSDEDRAPRGPFGMGAYSYDTTDIENLAKTTGGVFHTCDTADALTQIYREIDQLERSQVESIRYVTHRELYFPFLAWGIALFLIALTISATIFRRIP